MEIRLRSFMYVGMYVCISMSIDYYTYITVYSNLWYVLCGTVGGWEGIYGI